MTEVVIIGAGFVGQGIVEKLSKNRKIHITLVDKNDYISYKPLFPDVATGRLPAEIIQYPLAQFAQKKRIDYISGTITSIDPRSCEIVVNQRKKMRYDYLVVATGVEANFYGNDTFRRHVYTIDSLDECKRLQQTLHDLLHSDKQSIHVCVIGGGYTGIETATHLRKSILSHKKEHAITIIEAQDQILKMMPESIQNKAVEHLKKLHIDIMTNAQVTGITASDVLLNGQEKHIPADIVIWSAGMQGTDVASFFSSVTRQKRIEVNEYLHPDTIHNVFIAGDASSLYRMSVPIAKQYAQYVASSIGLLDTGKNPKPFKAKDYGYVIALANHRGMGNLAGVPVDGLPGYLFHYCMCALTLLGWKNKKKLLASIVSNMLNGKEIKP